MILAGTASLLLRFAVGTHVVCCLWRSPLSI